MYLLKGLIMENTSYESRHPTTLMSYLISPGRIKWRLVGQRLKENKHEAMIWYVDREDKVIRRQFLPIHAVFMNLNNSPEEEHPIPTRIVYELQRAHPAGLKSADADGMLPLHWACRSRASKDIIELLLNKYPGAAYTKDKWKRLPLHIACEFGIKERVILDLLLDANPSSINARNQLGQQPGECVDWTKSESIRLSPLKAKKRSQSKRMIDAFVEEAKTITTATEKQRSNSIGGVSIAVSELTDHADSRRNQPNSDVNVITDLEQGPRAQSRAFVKVSSQLQNYVDDINKKETEEETVPYKDSYIGPTQSGQETILPVLSKELFSHSSRSDEMGSYQSAPKTKETGPTPLLHFIRNQQWNEVKMMIQDVNQRSQAMVKDESNGWYPLHEVISMKPSVEVMSDIYLAYPEALHSKSDNFGRNVLHIACEFGADADVIDHILMQNMDLAQEVDQSGRTPEQCLVEMDPSYLAKKKKFEVTKKQEDTVRVAILHKDNDINAPLIPKGELTDEEGPLGTLSGKEVDIKINCDGQSQVSDPNMAISRPRNGRSNQREEIMNGCFILALLALLILAITLSILLKKSDDEDDDIPTHLVASFLERNISKDSTEVVEYDIDEVLNGPMNPFLLPR